jgi:prepilin-type N-terminal cleavage/methylation domain-containing protein/prepilin-type processing-associated H-X9-DG protein
MRPVGAQHDWNVAMGARLGRLTAAAGFSLLELLVVAAILAVVFTLYWKPGTGSRQRALEAACQRNLQKLQISMQTFATENGGNLPFLKGASNSAEVLDWLVPKYNSDVAVFICPESKDSVRVGLESLKRQKISYAYYMGRGTAKAQQILMTDAQVDTRPKIVGELVFSADGMGPGNNHGKSGGNLLFGDGHVEPSPARARINLPVGEGQVLLNP